VTGSEKDYAAWCRAFWKVVKNGLKRDITSTVKRNTCKHSENDKCHCKTDKDQHISSQVLLTDSVLYLHCLRIKFMRMSCKLDYGIMNCSFSSVMPEQS